jgi:hypothetical protein
LALGGVAGTLVEIVDAQALVTREVVDVVRRERIRRQVREAFVGRAQDVGHDDSRTSLSTWRRQGAILVHRGA